MLMTLLNQKINFHKLKNLSSEVCRFKPDAHAWDTINNLTQAKEELLQVLAQAPRANTRIRVVSELQLVVEEDGESLSPQSEEMLLSA